MATNLKICPDCSQLNPSDALYCSGCRHTFPASQTTISAQQNAAVAPQQPNYPAPAYSAPIPSPASTSWGAPIPEERPSPVGCLSLFGGFIVAWAAMGMLGNIDDSLVVLMWLGTTIWVGIDASKIGVKKDQLRGLANISITGWVLGCLFLWIFVFPAYVLARPALKQVNGK